MISFKHKFIYIHVPKTGGISISDALKDHTEDYISFVKSGYNVLNNDDTQVINIKSSKFLDFKRDYYCHASIEDLYKRLGNDIFSFYIFASIRNPFDRVVSQTSYVNGINTVPLVLQNFSMPKPQLDYLKIDGEVVVKNFIRFENLQNDFNDICRDIGIPEVKLSHKNKSRDSGYQHLYTESTKNMITRMYQDELDYFDYQF